MRLLTMLLTLGPVIHALLPPCWVAFMAGFITPIYLFRRRHFENINLKMRKQFRRKIECVLFGNKFKKLFLENISSLPDLFL